MKGETVVTKALTDRVEASEGRGGRGGRSVVNNFHITTPNADSFKLSQSQIQNKAFHAANTHNKRNG